MKITTKEKTIVLGYIVEVTDKQITILDDGEQTTFALAEKPSQSLAKCPNLKDSFIVLLIRDDVVIGFGFTGRWEYTIDVPQRTDATKTVTVTRNLFVGVAARITPKEKFTTVSVPVSKKDGTDWCSLKFWNDENEELGEKANFLLSSEDGEKRKKFFAITRQAKVWKGNDGKEIISYSVEEFHCI